MYCISAEAYYLSSMTIAVLPVFILLYYFWHKDKGEKEPIKLMRNVFLAGIAVIAPVILIEMALEEAFFTITDNAIIYMIVSPFIMVGLVEELAKLFIVKKVAYKHGRFNEVMDGITYAILASLGFAIIENVLYTYSYGLETGYLRAITAVPAHALFSGIMGYYIGMAKFEKNAKIRRKHFTHGVIAATFFHGLYNFLLSTNVPLLMLLVFPIIFYMWWVLHRAIYWAHTEGVMEPMRYI